MLAKDFLDIIHKDIGSEDYRIRPPIEAQRGIELLVDHFLGEDFYVVDPVSTQQFNTEAIYRILYRYLDINKAEEFMDIVYARAEEEGRDYGIICPPIRAQRGLDLIISYFLGKGFYISKTMSQGEINTDAIYRIISYHPGIKEIEAKKIINRIKRLLSKIKNRLKKNKAKKKKRKVKYYV